MQQRSLEDTNRKVVSRLLVLLLIAVIALALQPATAHAVPNRPPNWAGPCTVRVWPSWNGPWYQEHTKYIDVFGVPPQGYFLYRNGSSGKMESITLSPWEGNGNRWTRFGISTRWALTHLWWYQTDWYYVYTSDCDMRKGY